MMKQMLKKRLNRRFCSVSIVVVFLVALLILEQFQVHLLLRHRHYLRLHLRLLDDSFDL